MANDRIVIHHIIDHETKQITRQEIQGDKIVNTKVVAKFDVETGVLLYPNLRGLKENSEGVMAFISTNEWVVRAMQREDMKPDKAVTDKSVPPRPRKNKHEGDKTPEVVQWYFDQRPNEFATRYKVVGRYSGKVSFRDPVWEAHKDRPEVPEYQGTRLIEKVVKNAIVALRKTNLTFTPDECVDFDEDYTDNTADVEAEPKNVRKAELDVDET